MKSFPTVTAVIEVGAGLALLLPAQGVAFLFGAALTTPVELVVGRVAAVALLALGVTCWLARDDAESAAARGLAWGMLVYNVGVAAALAYAGAGMGVSGPGLWPAVLLHAGMAIWAAVLLSKPTRTAGYAK